MTLRNDHLHDPYLVGNGEWCPICCDGKPPPSMSQKHFMQGCNYCAGKGRIPFSAETIVRNTRAGGPQPDPPFVPTRITRSARRVERVRPQIRRRTV